MPGPRIPAAMSRMRKSVLPHRSSASRPAFFAEHAMTRLFLSEVIGAVLVSIALIVPATADPDAAKLFADNCAECHGADRLGRLGPALQPENLGRMMGPRIIAVIADGGAATQMPGC